MDITIIRLDRPPLASRITEAGSPRLRAAASYEPTPEREAMKTGTNELRAGDSGKPWFTLIDGEVRLVGLSSRGWHGESPHLSKFLTALAK
ncbi:MAG: hypothetical protein ACQKBY_11630 [Verrucomicrobiales bacterium]